MDPYQATGVTDTQLGLGGSVVKLINALPSDNYVLYFDNFFTSFKLPQYLANNNVKATVTVRANRVENPIMSLDVMKKKDHGTCEYRLDTTTNILVTRWNDNNVVTMASTCHGIELIGSANSIQLMFF